jgi:hypothetical protein
MHLLTMDRNVLIRLNPESDTTFPDFDDRDFDSAACINNDRAIFSPA